jgi:ATP-dependent Zn protease
MDERLVAIHEAGHAAADLVLGLGVELVTIMPKEDTAARAVG